MFAMKYIDLKEDEELHGGRGSMKVSGKSDLGAYVSFSRNSLRGITHSIAHPVFTRPLLQKGSSLQEEILSVCVCVSVRNHFFLLRIFNDLMV